MSVVAKPKRSTLSHSSSDSTNTKSISSNAFDVALRLLKHKHTRLIGLLVMLIAMIIPLLVVVLPRWMPQPDYEFTLEFLNEYVILFALDDRVR